MKMPKFLIKYQKFWHEISTKPADWLKFWNIFMQNLLQASIRAVCRLMFSAKKCKHMLDTLAKLSNYIGEGLDKISDWV